MEAHLEFVIDDIVGHASVDLLKGDTSLKAGERSTKAEVGAVPEAEVSVVRVMSKISAVAPNSRSSWFAAPMSKSTESPALIVWSWRSMSAVKVRCMYWVELWNRSTSSTAVAIRSGSAESSACWSGWRERSSTALATILVVVSCPAMTNSTQKPSSSCSLSLRPSTSASSRSVIRPVRSPARRDSRSCTK